ncbi:MULTISPECIES: shikimate dehydrogenase family protein [Sinorhizobium]|jgi:shikimate dehydrogenase|uniref:shikimate dehydrogenase (NADP(+)) n=1 Tax=Rhizobium meliloti TaxID=382 RepID=A0A2J0Z5M6_RHIML|nr:MULTISPECIES: shikimate dehydrogenase [Sinorhizobium]GCA51055.1 shikimate dehydrogenase [Sinorhizobium sp. KGO-5]PJR15768.1 shikimate dehydrogenase [Sinorhizobium meliloti]WEJ12400.1 shikimate dehydrogenase [Sinorhizobium sp. M103]WEJ18831.1 shikimate dehydrogenase [Sinorhizobium sp. K101]WEJ39235.1 shikimate dehydrogenase [Sinorhizobium sp. C101]
MKQRISGTTRVVVHLAYPSHHLRTPTYFNAYCAERSLDAVLVPWQVSPQNLAAAFDGLRWVESLAGVIVTIPHKTSVASLCDGLSETARFLGVANVARRTPDGSFHGEMFDGAGFVQGLLREGHEIRGRRALLVGAGGAATGIAEALVRGGTERLAIANRSAVKAEELAERLREAFPGSDAAAAPADARGFDLVVNATSLGMKAGDPLPVDPGTLEPGALVAEVVMEPDVTPLLRLASERGCVVHKGVHMITGQIEVLAKYLLDEPGA